MDDSGTPSLEAALAKAQSHTEATLRGAAAVTASLKRARSAASVGNLRELRAALEASEQAAAALRGQVERTRAGWDFDEEAYLAGGDYTRELLGTAQRMGVAMYEQDARLYCYPSLVRVLPNERAVSIDRQRERRLRPSVLVAHLRDLQGRPPKFRPEAFLQSLFEAYETLVAAQGQKRGKSAGRVVRLRDIYDLLTLLPGSSRDYSLQEFARDVYLLDQSGVITTRRGDVLTFEASTGTRSATATISVITQSGQEKRYYGIAFTRDE